MLQNQRAKKFTNEEISQLNVIPEVFPDFFLRGSCNMDEVTANFYMRAVDDGKVGSNFLNERNETRHLWVIWGTLLSV